jgi:predicted dehydrogenase
MSTLRAGIIGLGRIASTMDDRHRDHHFIALPFAHMACLREIPEVEVVAAADPSAERRSEFSERWGLTNLYGDAHKMLERERLDLVTIATSADVRHEMVVAAARSGVRGIYAEKPMAITLAEADSMVQIAREHGSALAVGCTRRSDPWWKRVKRLIDEDELGPIRQINVMADSPISLNGSHLIDLIRYLANDEVAWVFGESDSDSNANSDDDHRLNGYLAFRGGIRAFLRTWPSGALDWSCDVVGERGTIRSTGNGANFEWLTMTPDWVVSSRNLPRPQRFRSPGVNAFYDLIECMETGNAPVCSGEDGRAALEIAIALRESHRLGGCRVDLPVSDRSLGIRSADVIRSQPSS